MVLAQFDRPIVPDNRALFILSDWPFKIKLHQERHDQEHVAPNGAGLLVETKVYKPDAPTALKFEIGPLPEKLSFRSMKTVCVLPSACLSIRRRSCRHHEVAA